MIYWLFAQLVSCAVLTGLIWTIQILHYPSFLRIPKQEFVNFHQQHSHRITFIVAPVMLIELFSALYLISEDPTRLDFLASGVLVALIWLSTFFWSVPIHNRLERGYDAKLIRRLVRTNWPRTVLWSTRLILLSYGILDFIVKRL